jgi:hypothetical protein
MRTAAILTLAGFLAAAAAHAQHIPDRPSCEQCRISSSLVAMLEHESISEIRSIVVDARGRYWVVNNAALPTLFNARGEFEAVVGRRGSGPAELNWPQAVWQLPGDSIAIVEMNGKVVVLDADLTYARTTLLGVSAQVNAAIVLEWPSRVLLNADLAAPVDVRAPLHLLDLTGSPGVIRQSFGAQGNVTPEQRFSAVRRVLSPAANGHFWVARLGEYVATRYSSSLEAGRTVSRRPDWFSAVSTARVGSPRTPPEPVLIGIEEDEAGRLWVYTRVPRPDWRRAWQRVPAEAAEVPVTAIDVEYLYYTRIEVLDVDAGRVVARHTLDRSAGAILPGRRAAFVLEDAAGRPIIRVLQFTLSGNMERSN